MDNPNNPNSTNPPTGGATPNPWDPVPTRPIPDGTSPTPPLPTDQPPNINPQNQSVDQANSMGQVTSPTLEQPVQSTPTPNPLSEPAPIQSEPASTFVPSQPTSPLDNPWGAPVQPPPLDGPAASSQSTWGIPTVQEAPAPRPEVVPNQVNQQAPPTDLSHLISPNPQQNQSIPPETQTNPETLVVPQASPMPEVSAMPTENRKGIPKWLIGVGIGLLIVVGGASAYFILGWGQPPKTTTSVPATQTPKTQTVKPPPPVATPVVQPSPTPEATGSANFGQLGGGSGTQQATSAADLLRQRQQQGR